MDFSPQQAKGLEAANEWYKGGKSTSQVFRMFGYAGTGKSTIAKYLIETLGCKAVSATFTGKAASVLQKKGTPASTIHSLIYTLADQDEELIQSLKKRMAEAKESSPSLFNVLKQEFKTANKPRFELRPPEHLSNVDLIVIDEVSMVNEELGNDLLSFGKKILVLGDPAQLPPIEGGGFFTKGDPDILLTEIHRQARDNPIINMASIVRQGHRLRPGKYGSSECIRYQSANDLDPRKFEQIIVGTNNTRKGWNSRYRELLGAENALPLAGEKVICLRNNKELGILNGTQWAVRSAEERGYGISMELDPWGEEPENEGVTISEDPESLEVVRRGKLVEAHAFSTDLSELEWYQRNQLEEFDFGYAITCHKSQGSQWETGLVINQAFVFQARDGKPDVSKNWLYTALTRFSDRVTVTV